MDYEQMEQEAILWPWIDDPSEEVVDYYEEDYEE